jgi:Esterase-like activity of phytase
MNRNILLAAALALTTPTHAEAQSLSATVLDSIILPVTEVDGLKISELSGLAYDADDRILYAVSDKSRIFHIVLDVTGDKLTTLKPAIGLTLIDAAGSPMHDAGFNAEGLEALNAANGTVGDTRLIILSEDGPRAAEFSTQGQWIADLSLPGPLMDPAVLRGPNDGVEAVTMHPSHGLITAPQEPLLDAVRTLHTLFAADGATFSYSTDDIGSTGLKGLTTLTDGRLLVLERTRSEDRLTLTPFLRLIDPASCEPPLLCTTVTFRVDVPGIMDADYEGVAEVSPGLFLLASDDEIDGIRRTVFALVRIASS